MTAQETTHVNWMDGLETIDQGTVEQLGSQYPYIQWVHGDPKAKKLGGLDYTGGWFMAEGQVPEDLLKAAGWTPFTLQHQSGGETAGFGRRDVTVSILQQRHCWMVQDGESPRFFAWDQYDQAKGVGAPRGKTQVLVVVQGLEDVGPIVLTMRGSVGQAFSDSGRGGVLGAFNACVIKPANLMAQQRKIKARWAFRAFWLTVGPRRESNGDPKFDTVGQGNASSQVTLPTALGLKDKPAESDIRAAYVGRALLETLNAMQQETLDWKAAWDEMAQTEPSNGHEETAAVPDLEKEALPF